MPDATRRLEISVTPFGRKRLAAALLAFVIGVLAIAQPAKAEGVRGGFGGVQGWGGLYRDNRDVGYFPVYVAYGDAFVVEQAYPRLHSHIPRHSLRRHHRAVAHHCAPTVRHCVCH